MSREVSKRILDLLISVPALLLLSPLLVAIAIWIRLDSPGPVFFRQVRIGRGGRLFRILKFRTMVRDAERLGGPLTVGSDPRITRSGAFLRKYKFDEFPQLINVVLGDMSLVGPRPEVAVYLEHFEGEHRRFLDLLPGITGPASIKYRNENELLADASEPERVYLDKILPDKIRIGLEYADRATVWSDLRIILGTVLRLKG